MEKLKLVLIAAVSRNGVLASGGKIPWHLPRDIAHFRDRTTGRWLLLGRTTYLQMTDWFKPGQVPVVLTRQAGFRVPGGWAVSSVAEGLDLARQHGAEELVVCGGGEVYAAALPRADELILTKVDAAVPGDTFFPALAEGEWEIMEEECFPADADHAFAMTICRMVRTGLRLPDGAERR